MTNDDTGTNTVPGTGSSTASDTLPDTIWPQTDAGIDGPPEHPVLLSIYQALRPLAPLLRQLNFFPGGEPSVLLGLGAEAYATEVRLHGDDTLLVIAPVGLVPQTAENMHALLSRNLQRFWPLRADISGASRGQVLVVTECRLPLTHLDLLPGCVLEAWRQKRMAEALLDDLKGNLNTEGDWL